jgi:hypothetical protein
MTDQERRHLAQADRHIAECKEHIACQKKLIGQLTQRGQSTLWAEDMLEALHASLRAFEKHRANHFSDGCRELMRVSSAHGWRRIENH